jgi:hypothetical protein
MNKLKYWAWLVKLNMLWLFKYRCRIPEGVIFSWEELTQGSIVGYTNKRLHIVRKLSADHDWKVKPKSIYHSPESANIPMRE